LQADGQQNIGSKSGHSAATSQGSTPNGQLHDVHSVLETKLSGSLITIEIADRTVMECPEAVDVSSTISSNDKHEKAAHGSIRSTFNMDNDESESKRRLDPITKYMMQICHPSKLILIGSSELMEDGCFCHY
jgi:WRKY transcription factor 2